MVQDVMAPVVQGALQAAQLAVQIRAAMLDEQKLGQAKQREEREAEVQDIRTRLMLEGAGRPVVGGAVEVDVPAPKFPGVPGVFPEQERAPVRTLRPVARESLVKWKDLAGVERQYELRSQQEQVDEEIRRRVAEAQAMREAQKEPFRTTLPREGEFITPADLRRSQQIQEQMVAEERARRLEAERKERDRTFEAGRNERARRAEAGRKERAEAKSPPGQLTQNQRLMEEERKQDEKRKIEGEIEAVDAQIAKLEAEAAYHRQVLQTPDDKLFLGYGQAAPPGGQDPPKMNKLYRGRIETRLDAVEAEIKGQKAARDRRSRLIGWGETTGAGATPGARGGALSPAGEAYLKKLAGGR